MQSPTRSIGQQRIETLIRRLKENDPTLTELDFRNVDGSRSYAFISGSVFQEVLEALHANSTVTNVNLILRFFQKLPFDEKMELFEAVGSLPSLQQIRFGSSGFAGPPLRLINSALRQTSGNLKSLTLHSIHFKDNVFHKTTSSTNIRDEEYVEFLDIVSNRLRNLESFTLQDVEDSFDLDSLTRVLLTIPTLTDLAIRSFSVFSQRLTRRSVEELFSSKSIKSLAIRRMRLGPILAELLIGLEENRTLEVLSLEQNELNLECGMALAYLLGTNQTLRELNVAFNMIPDNCGSAIAGALARNSTLTSLNLKSNDLELYTCRQFAHLLVSNESCLESLSLSQNSLLDEGVAMIAAGIGQNTTLKSLAIAETKLTEAACSVVAASLHMNSTLERLNLSDNRIRDEGCFALAEALKHNSTLTSLNLFGNQLRDKSVLCLAESLKINASLERVNLANNPDMTPVAYNALEGMLMRYNYKLKHLWLPSTQEIVAPNSSIPSFIRLNRIGRKELMENLGDARLWTNAIESSASDIHCLYFLVRSNPAVVSWLP